MCTFFASSGGAAGGGRRGVSLCPQKGLSSWAYQSQHRGRLLAGGAKRQLLLPPQPPPPHTLDLSSPDFVTPPQTQTQGQKRVCSQMHKERKRNIKCAYASHTDTHTCIYYQRYPTYFICFSCDTRTLFTVLNWH